MAGCSFSPDGTWKSACDIHDIGYKQVWIMRKERDLKFYENLKNTKKKWLWIIKPKWIAPIYYYAVRIFGRLAV